MIIYCDSLLCKDAMLEIPTAIFNKMICQYYSKIFSYTSANVVNAQWCSNPLTVLTISKTGHTFI